MLTPHDDWYPPPELSSVAERFTDPWPFIGALERLKEELQRQREVHGGEPG
jgi:hypothetical protein